MWYTLGMKSEPIQIIEYDKIYCVDIGITCVHLCLQQLNRICRDGRVASVFLQTILPHLFSDIESMPNDNPGYDFKSKTTNEVFEMKNFTLRESAIISKKTGEVRSSTTAMNFSASKHQGTGRKYNETEHFAHAIKTTYILCDIVDVPMIRIRFIKGSELVKLYPNPKVGYGERQNIFN